MSQKLSRRFKRQQRPLLIKALRMIENAAENAMCDCNDSEKTRKPGYFCYTCHIYTIAHGVLGCCKGCPSAHSGRQKLAKWSPE